MADVHYNKRLVLLNYFHTIMFPDRFHRAFSAFNHSTRRWAHLLGFSPIMCRQQAETFHRILERRHPQLEVRLMLQTHPR